MRKKGEKESTDAGKHGTQRNDKQVTSLAHLQSIQRTKLQLKKRKHCFLQLPSDNMCILLDFFHTMAYVKDVG